MDLPSASWLLLALIVICLAAGIWLMLHLTAVAAAFRGNADIVPSPKRPHASRGAVFGALAVFGASLIAILATQALAISA